MWSELEVAAMAGGAENIPLIAIVAASVEEAGRMRAAGEALEAAGCAHEVKLASVWSGPQALLEWAAQAEVRGVKVLLAAAGEEPQLAGMLAAESRLPVIAVPVTWSSEGPLKRPSGGASMGSSGGSSGGTSGRASGRASGGASGGSSGEASGGRGAEANLRLAREINRGALAPVAVVAAGGARQAAVLALRILAIGDAHWRAVLLEMAEAAAEELEDKNEALQTDWRTRPDFGELSRVAIEEVDLDDAGGLRRAQSSRAIGGEGYGQGGPDEDDVPVYDLTGQNGPRGKPPRLVEAGDEPARVRPAEELNRPLAGAGRGVRAGDWDEELGDDEDEEAPAETTREAARPATRDRDREAAAKRRRFAGTARRLGRLPVDPDSPDVAVIEEVVDCLLEGGIVAFPTETVYGLAADATNPAAVERLFALKGRDTGKAVSLMVDSSKLLAAIAQNVTVEMKHLMEAFWPGPLTIVFQKRPINFRHVSPGGTIGVRLPDHSVPLAIMQALARPLACTSANHSGQPDARDADTVEAAFGDRIEALLDGGRLPERKPSTVLDVTQEPYRILRVGSISHQQIETIIGEKLEPEG
jgi:tRNA threonylcarbamoyl adenosine modification protein (Sua5/YciO/YrdC/YwlC family)